MLAADEAFSFPSETHKPVPRASGTSTGARKAIVGRRRAPRILSVFSGAGGLDLGLEAAGFRVIGCVEKDDLARKTLARNRPRWKLLEPSDVSEFARTVKPSDLDLKRGQLEVLAGGPPCQPFSKAAQWHARSRAGLDDPRAACFPGFIQLIETFLPKVVLIENVQGFTDGKTSALPLLQGSLSRINSTTGSSYKANANVVDACDYGVPQHRRRSIIVVRKDGGNFSWPRPTHDERPVRAWDAIGDLRPRNPPSAIGKWAGLLPSIPEGANYIYHTPKGDGAELFGYRTRYWSFLLKLAKEKPSWTLPAQPPQNAGPFHWDNRRLTPKEMMRLQSFPKGWKIAGEYEDRVRQIGNATPPLLAEVIGRAIDHQIFGRRHSDPPILTIPRHRVVPPPSIVAGVPGRFLVGEHHTDPHPGPGLGPGALRATAANT